MDTNPKTIHNVFNLNKPTLTLFSPNINLSKFLNTYYIKTLLLNSVVLHLEFLSVYNVGLLLDTLNQYFTINFLTLCINTKLLSVPIIQDYFYQKTLTTI